MHVRLDTVTVGQRLLRAAAGREPWGRLELWPSRYGYAHYRLTVYPPGTSLAERAWLRVWGATPYVGAALALVVVCGAVCVVDLGDAIAAAVLVEFAAIGSVGWRTRRLRPWVHTRQGATEHLGRRLVEHGDMALITASWNRLAAADGDLAAGLLTATEHELVWASVWATLARERRGAARTS